ncbi:hypothetical protein GQ602_000339 [Ophiocordyceps camponoti-floridani]|uniref:Uncharacterized protein n=1 Tax=Ophiocordyceps camponoti-floridani TaxID=2030778 RepID=A0A8H4QBY7_9HYPO|nr:hypothetical protein GQ602_000339 [Ophiocordyceps camponoti-floridani]
MVIGLLVITAIPTITGVGQAVSAQKKQNAASKEQAKFNLTALTTLPDGTERESPPCVLKNGKLVVDMTGRTPLTGHKFSGYHFTYPSAEQELGLVSTISDDPPLLNWIYVNGQTRAVEHGGRRETVGHVVGPWGWSRDERLLTVRGGRAASLLERRRRRLVRRLDGLFAGILRGGGRRAVWL